MAQVSRQKKLSSVCFIFIIYTRYIDIETGRRSDTAHHYIYNQDHNKNLNILDRHRVVRVIFEYVFISMLLACSRIVVFYLWQGYSCSWNWICWRYHWKSKGYHGAIRSPGVASCCSFCWDIRIACYPWEIRHWFKGHLVQEQYSTACWTARSWRTLYGFV